MLSIVGGEEQILDAFTAGIGRCDIVQPLGTDGSTWLILRPATQRVPSRTILVIDDDPAVVEFYVDALEPLGTEIVTATSGADALKMLELTDIGLALVDVRLPDMNGFELCRELVSQCPSMDVIVMSADAALVSGVAAKVVGALDQIANPIGPDELLHRVTNALELRDQAAAEVFDNAARTRTRLQLFSKGEVTSGSVVVPIPRGRSMEIVASLAAAMPSPLSPERLRNYAWAASEDSSPSAVYTAISRLRQYFADHHLHGFILNSGDGYTLDIEPADVDLIDFERQVQAAIAPNSPAHPNEVRDLLDKYSEVVFAESSNPLLQRWRQRLIELRSRAMEVVAEHAMDAEEHPLAISTCTDLLSDEPWRESAWILLITALYRAGRPRDALTTYTQATCRLRDDYGLSPSPKLASMELQVLTHDPALLGKESAALLST